MVSYQHHDNQQDDVTGRLRRVLFVGIALALLALFVGLVVGVN